MAERYRIDCLNPACRWVGYRRPHPLNDCACYSDYAYYCRPTSPGPGCPNGVNLYANCPRCKSDWEPDHRDLFHGSRLAVRQAWSRQQARQILAGRARLRSEEKR